MATLHMSVGNAMPDIEHKRLIGMVNGIQYTIGTKNSFALLGAIKLFRDSVDTHFANEARFARALDFHFEQHDLAHRRFQEELRQKTDKLVASIGMWSECAMVCYPQFLGDWLTGHIAGEDMKMKPLLQNHPYGFRPV